MLTCENYRMFRGWADFMPRTPGFPVQSYHGTWLYNPTNNYWYLNGCDEYPYGTSFHASRITNIREDS